MFTDLVFWLIVKNKAKWQGTRLSHTLWCLILCVNWAMGCLDIWLKIIFGMSVSMFLEEITIWIGYLSKADGPHQCSAWIEQKARGRVNSLSAWLLSWEIDLPLSSVLLVLKPP